MLRFIKNIIINDNKLREEVKVLFYIYEIINNINNKKYIGSTNNLKDRFNKHKRELKNNKHHSIYFQRFYNKYKPKLSINILYKSNDETYIRKLEEKLINENYENLFNVSKLASGGDLISYNPRKNEIVENISKTMKLHYKNLSNEEKIEISKKYLGKKNGNYKNGKRSKEYLENQKILKNKIVKKFGLKDIHSIKGFWNYVNKLYNVNILNLESLLKFETNKYYVYGYIIKSETHLNRVVGKKALTLVNSKNDKYKEIRLANKDDLLNCEYLKDEDIDYIRSKISRGVERKVVFNGIIFDSIVNLSKILKVSDTSINNKINNKNINDFYYYDYTEHNNSLIEYNPKEHKNFVINYYNKKYIKTKKVFCENKIYNSVTNASKDLNILRSTLTNRLKSKNFKNYYYI